MIIDCISDLHGYYPELEGGDLLIVAGDLTARDTEDEHLEFSQWLAVQDYKHKIVIAGNHDNQLEKLRGPVKAPKLDYLEDSGTEFEYEEQISHPASTEHVSIDVLMYQKRKLKIWGSPWTKTFPGMNPHCKAFTCDTEEELAKKWELIPDDIDILITHAPVYGMRDGRNSEQRLGSTSLLQRCVRMPLFKSLKLHVCGHIHEGYGKYDIRKFQKDLGDPIGCVTVNASIVNERYQHVNKPIRIEL